MGPRRWKRVFASLLWWSRAKTGQIYTQMKRFDVFWLWTQNKNDENKHVIMHQKLSISIDKNYVKKCTFRCNSPQAIDRFFVHFFDVVFYVFSKVVDCCWQELYILSSFCFFFFEADIGKTNHHSDEAFGHFLWLWTIFVFLCHFYVFINCPQQG